MEGYESRSDWLAEIGTRRMNQLASQMVHSRLTSTHPVPRFHHRRRHHDITVADAVPDVMQSGYETTVPSTEQHVHKDSSQMLGQVFSNLFICDDIIPSSLDHALHLYVLSFFYNLLVVIKRLLVFEVFMVGVFDK